jgi:hypothetical protein
MKIYNPQTGVTKTVTEQVAARALREGWVKADAELKAPAIVKKPKKQPNEKLPKAKKAQEVDPEAQQPAQEPVDFDWPEDAIKLPADEQTDEQTNDEISPLI